MRLSEVFDHIVRSKGGTYLRTWMLECLGRRKAGTEGRIHISDYDGHPVAKLFCLSVVFEIKLENMSVETLKRVLLELDDHIQKNTGPKANVLTKVQNFSAVNSRNLCQCMEPNMSRTEELSRVMTADHIIFLWNNLPGVIPWNEEINSSEAAQRLSDQMQRRQSTGLSLTPFKGYYLSLFWFSRGQDLRQYDHLPAGSSKAKTVRDILGLAHMRSGYGVEIRFRKDHLKKASTPCFFDSGPYEYFCPVNKSDRWGRTRQLPRLQEGLPEAVHLKTDWPRPFDFNFLGPMSFPQLPSEEDWNYLVKALWDNLVKFDSDVPEELVETLTLPR